jgi:hypothetical protein
MITRRRFGELVSGAVAAICARPPFAEARQLVSYSIQIRDASGFCRDLVTVVANYDDGSCEPVGRIRPITELSYNPANGWHDFLALNNCSIPRS